jgi:hypothetical protein
LASLDEWRLMILSDTGAWLLLFAGPLTRVSLPRPADPEIDAYYYTFCS